MAKVKGVKEKVHMPIYDAFFVPGVRSGTAAKRSEEVMTDPRVVQLSVDVQNKTKLETNLQAARVLLSLNTFEARAMRVLSSTFCPPKDALAILKAPILNAADMYRNAKPWPMSDGQPPPQAEVATRDQIITTVLAEFASIIGTPSVNGHLRQAILDAADTFRNAKSKNNTANNLHCCRKIQCRIHSFQ